MLRAEGSSPTGATSASIPSSHAEKLAMSEARAEATAPADVRSGARATRKGDGGTAA